MFLAFHLDNYPYQASLLLPNFQAIGRLPALLLFCSFSHQQVNNSNPITPHSGVGIPTSYLYNCCWCSCFVSLLPYCVCLSCTSLFDTPIPLTWVPFHPFLPPPLFGYSQRDTRRDRVRTRRTPHLRRGPPSCRSGLPFLIPNPTLIQPNKPRSTSQIIPRPPLITRALPTVDQAVRWPCRRPS